jgi:hypothetical protein
VAIIYFQKKYVDVPGVPPIKDPHIKKRTLKTLSFLLAAILISGGIHVYRNYESILLLHRHHLPIFIAYKLPEYFDRPFNPVWLQNIKYKSINRAFQKLVKEELNEKHPLYTHNEQITLELQNGRKRSGTFTTTTPNSVLIQIDSEIYEIQFSNLKPKSRVQCDLAERKTFIYKVAHNRALTFMVGDSQEKISYPPSTYSKHTPLLGKKEGGSTNKGRSKPKD